MFYRFQTICYHSLDAYRATTEQLFSKMIRISLEIFQWKDVLDESSKMHPMGPGYALIKLLKLAK